TVGVILHGCDFGGDAVLVALEVDDAVFVAVAAADVTHGDPARRVPAARLVERDEKGALGSGRGDLFIRGHRHETTRGRCGFILLNSHSPFLLMPGSRRT